jgi:hypothetical protein
MLTKAAPGLVYCRTASVKRPPGALPAEDGRRRRPPAGPALRVVEKLLTTKLTSTDTTERNAGMLRVLLVAMLVELATGSG